MAGVKKDSSQNWFKEFYGSNQLGFILGGIVLGGVAVSVATGLIVYYVFCVNQLPNANDVIQSQGQLCNCTFPPFCPPTRLCSKDPVESCPINPLMPEIPDLNTCIVPCQPECNERNCKIPPPASCPPIITQAPSKQVPPFHLTRQQFSNQSVLDWVRAYPPNSYGRLQVLTQLMEYGVENYVRMMSRRNCQQPFRMCTFCQDRYEYLKCAMRTKVTANKLERKEAYILKEIPADFLEKYSYKAYWHSNGNNYLLPDSSQSLIDAFQAFWFAADDGTECTWCSKDTNVWRHLDCVWCGYPYRDPQTCGDVIRY